MEKFGFVILNYKSYDETICCVETIENVFKSKGESIYLLIIDNASNDGSFNKLIQRYGECKYIEVLEMHANLGFSKANNIGYKKIREMQNIDFMIICNSDIEFRQGCFKEKLIEIYGKTKFDICGPDVFAPHLMEKHQSPTWPWEYTKLYTKINTELHYCKENTGIFRKLSYVVMLYFLKLLKKTLYRNFRHRYHFGTAIHGSCIILSGKFIEKHENVFWPETEFYYEELLLYLRIKREKLLSIYSPEIQVIHRQGRSSAKRICNEGNSRWIKKNMVTSGNIYLKELENYRKNNVKKGM